MKRRTSGRDEAQLEHCMHESSMHQAGPRDAGTSPHSPLGETGVPRKEQMKIPESIKPHLCLPNLFRPRSPRAYAGPPTSAHKRPCGHAARIPRIPCCTTRPALHPMSSFDWLRSVVQRSVTCVPRRRPMSEQAACRQREMMSRPWTVVTSAAGQRW
jgi:hypothetical protein